ncbi:MAG: hypothetical protein FWD90_10130 [Defluviitaleaceae bacterium]|nr:hypothetical protein [Defluviitaleaceae bacterium]
MPQAVYNNSYKLKKGTSVPEFRIAVDNLFKQIAKAKGHISSTLLLDGDTWADHSVWETMDDLKVFINEANANPSELSLAFYEFLNFNTCKSHVYSVEDNW